eukprot:scaffold170309_cov21-Prasinocladus_malaysianus.AAC.1
MSRLSSERSVDLSLTERQPAERLNATNTRGPSYDEDLGRCHAESQTGQARFTSEERHDGEM